MKNYLIIVNRNEVSYIRKFSELLPPDGNHKAVTIDTDTISMANLELMAKGYDAIINTSSEVCKLLFNTSKVYTADSKYIGSLAKLSTGIEVLMMLPLQQLYTTSTGIFLAKRYISKLSNKEKWLKVPEFEWCLVGDNCQGEELLKHLRSENVLACALDIEVSNKIYCVGFGILTKDFNLFNYVVPINTTSELLLVKEALDTPCPKIMQNGMFDATWLLHYGLPIRNWLWDTLGMMHSWYSELPRRLDFISSFFLRDSIYWKDEGKSSSMMDKYRYNAKDVYNTALIFVAWMHEAPSWAKENYRITFPEVFPMIHCGLEGIKVDSDKKESIKNEQETILREMEKEIQVAANHPININSPKQLSTLLSILGVKNVKGTDEKNLLLYSKTNPLVSWFAPKILAFKGASKLLGTYVNTELYGDRLLYSLNPFGTETGRTASKSSNLFNFNPHKTGSACFEHYGTQVQNLPPYFKKMLVADDGWELFEIDKSASESWCTAALSREKKLWEVLTTKKDFHCANASMFFGIPYNQLYDDETETVLNKPLRDLAKRVNHGANYNMGASVLVATMGEEKVFEAKNLILAAMKEKGDDSTYQYKTLLYSTTAESVAKFLLSLFDSAYPAIRGRWQKEIIREISVSSRLSNPSGWTRYCFGNPMENKRDLNAYIAHSPQHLSVKMVNKSLIDIWKTLSLPLGSNIRLKAQIHDSIFGQYRIGFEDEVRKAEELMRVKVIVHGKELCIPNDIEFNGRYWK